MSRRPGLGTPDRHRRASRGPVLAVGLAVGLAALTLVRPHGASKGMHVHADPDPAAPGAVVRFSAEADRPLAAVRWSCGRGTPRVARSSAEPAETRMVWSWRVPESTESGVLACRFERVRRGDGEARRTAIVLRVERVQSSPVGQATPVPPRPQ